MIAKAFLAFGFAGVALVALTGCEKPVKAPNVEGECYFIGHPADGTITFNSIAHKQPDLEHCAVYVYNARMDMLRTGTAGEVTEGAYNGNFLWATNTEVRMSLKYESPRFPFLVKANGKLVQPGSIVSEEPEDKAPRTVEIPDNLPQKTDKGIIVTQDPADVPPKK